MPQLHVSPQYYHVLATVVIRDAPVISSLPCANVVNLRDAPVISSLPCANVVNLRNAPVISSLPCATVVNLRDAPVIGKDDPEKVLAWSQEPITCHIPDREIEGIQGIQS